jgi:twitching motility protein PilT
MKVQIHELLTFAVQNRASDIHLAAGEIPAVRIDGEIKRLDLDVLTADDGKRLAFSIMNEKQKVFFEKNLEIDFSIGLKGLARFRVNVFTQSRGIGLVLRQIPSKVLTLEEISAPSVFKTIAEYSKGLVLVTGPTGSGKSTSLAAVIDHINRSRHEHVLTVEDPIEFVHVPQKCIINQREVGAHTLSFSNALRSALREDPDVILVGEMRDLETVSLALTAAETGHLVFGTLHTNSAPETIDRIIDSYPHEQQAQVRTMLSTALQAVVTQKLIRRTAAKGSGRVAAHEIMIVTPAIRNLIRENKLFQIPSAMQAGRADGMQTMEMAVKDLVARREITVEQAISVTNNPKIFEDESPDQYRRRMMQQEGMPQRRPPGGA